MRVEKDTYKIYFSTVKTKTTLMSQKVCHKLIFSTTLSQLKRAL